MIVLAIDPGTTDSAYVVFNPATGWIRDKGKVPNAAMRQIVIDLSRDPDVELAVEMIACYGMSVGKSVFDTVLWVGRFMEAWRREVTLVYRSDVKMALFGKPKGNDKAVRGAMIFRFGPSESQAIGDRAKPGPLFGVTADIWASLAVAVVYSDSKRGIMGMYGKR